MKAIKYLYLTTLLLLSTLSFAKDWQSKGSDEYARCDILIHGFSFKKDSDQYFGDLPNQVIWDSSEEIEVAAPTVAQGILEKMENCAHDAPVTLRPHSYGAAVVHFILGKGNLFQDAFPDHPYVLIYKRTTEVYAFTGAYHGTPLMDVVCANRFTRAIIELLGTSCVKGLSTSEIDNVGTKVTSAGIPTYLIYSTKREAYLGTTGLLLAKHMVSFKDFRKGLRNQNDDTLPLYAAKGCAVKQIMESPDAQCEKLDPYFMEDFYHTNEYGHLEFRKIREFMYMTK
ncbi:MAG: hypothetical protein CME60_11115 [Halobacteriovoraceae bacterium]|nr:hypothetical protein [Halobacteriovoraceae bacterium]